MIIMCCGCCCFCCGLGSIRSFKAKHFEDRSQPPRFIEYMVSSITGAESYSTALLVPGLTDCMETVLVSASCALCFCAFQIAIVNNCQAMIEFSEQLQVTNLLFSFN